MYFIKHPHPFSRMFHSGKDSIWCLCNDISLLLSFVYKKVEWNDSCETSTSIFQNGTFWKGPIMMFPLISFLLFFFLFKKLTLWRLRINFWFCLLIKELMCSYSVTKRHKWTEHKSKKNKEEKKINMCFQIFFFSYAIETTLKRLVFQLQ